MIKMSYFGNLILLSFMTQLVAIQSSCPEGQIWHQSTAACCIPKQSCKIEFELEPCIKNGTEDKCVTCGTGRTNGYITSSFDYKDHRCFTLEDRHNDCPRGDTVPIPTHENEKCAQPCRCRLEDCYYGDPCACGLANVCGVNEELHHSGECKPCRAGMFKPTKSCGPCLWNVTAWKLSPGYNEYEVASSTTDNGTIIKVIDLPSTQTTSKSSLPPDTDKKQEAESGDVSMVAVLIVIALLVFVGILVAIILVVRRKIKSGDRSSRLVQCYYKIMKKDLTDQDPERGAAQPEDNPPPVQEVTPFIQEPGTSSGGAEGGRDEPRMDNLKSQDSNGHASPTSGAEDPTPADTEATEPEDEANTTVTPLIGGTEREDDETEQKVKD